MKIKDIRKGAVLWFTEECKRGYGNNLTLGCYLVIEAEVLMSYNDPTERLMLRLDRSVWINSSNEFIVVDYNLTSGQVVIVSE